MKTHDSFSLFAPGTLSRTLWKAVLLVLLLLCFYGTPAVADDYSDALKKAKAEDKAMALYFYSTYCPYCTAMETQVLADKEINAIMTQRLVSLRINVDKRADLAKKYGIRGYPTTALLEPSGKSIVKVPGYMDKKTYKVFLEYARGKYYKTVGLREYFKKSGIEVD